MSRNEVIEPVHCSSISAELAKRAQEELNENPDQLKREYQEFKELIEGDNSLTVRTDDAFLLRYLRSCEHDVEWAFQTLRKFYLMKAKNPNLYSKFRPSTMAETFNEGSIVVLPDRDALGRRIFLSRPGRWNPRKSSIEDVFLCWQICMENVIDEEETQISGIVVIFDMHGFGLNHAAHIRPGVVRKWVTLIQDFFPARFHGFHYVNEPSFFGMFFHLLKHLLSAEVYSRVRFHGQNRESLHKYFKSDILPEDLGGSKPPVDTSAFVKSLLARDDKIADVICNYGYL